MCQRNQFLLSDDILLQLVEPCICLLKKITGLQKRRIMSATWKQRLTWWKTRGLRTKKKASGSSMDKEKVNNAKRFKGNCYICGKSGHRVKDCRSKKKDTQKKKPPQANMTEVDKISTDVGDINLSAVVSEVNLVSNAKDWWLDPGATRHICADKGLFAEYKILNHNECL
ncbi:uncharacterized protein LOC111392192 [Olea europaea var. sylvestris]|uniref:uncharacterized protein LOC111392192 n=1 Tax=Olea europaea var. sylvestris TaxID=158386 RepID=UPI000C1D418F|nr:uncharacterized protein LOC111392192 [Olea europaea var. sylvestris]